MHLIFKSLLLVLALSFGTQTQAATTPPSDGLVVTVRVMPTGKIEFRVKNDTGSNVRLYTGSGYTTINRGSSTRFERSEGTKFYRGEGGRKGDFLFKVTSDLDGETIELSEYI